MAEYSAHRGACAVAVLLLLGCGGPSPPSAVYSEEVIALFHDPDRSLMVLGLDHERQDFGTGAGLHGSRFVRGDALVMAVRSHAPYLVVYDFESRERAAFIDEGDGPGEAMIQWGVSAASDGHRVIVTTRGRLYEFDIDGEFREAWRVPDGVLVGQVYRACDDDWYVLAQASIDGASIDRPTIGRFDFSADGIADVRVVANGPAGAQHASAGMPRLFEIPGGQGLVVRFRNPFDPDFSDRLQHVPCAAPGSGSTGDAETGNADRGIMEILETAGRLIPSLQRTRQRSYTVPVEGGTALRMQAGMPTPVGAQWLDGGLLYFETTVSGPPPRVSTHIWYVRSGGRVARALLPGSHNLLDRMDDGALLVRRADPIPHLVVVDGAELARVLGAL